MIKKLLKLTRSLGHRSMALIAMVVFTVSRTYAQDATAINSALEEVRKQIESYVSPVQYLIWAIACIVGLAGGFSIYNKMNNEEQDVKKSIVMYVGSFLFLIAMGFAVPTIFGVSTGSGS